MPSPTQRLGAEHEALAESVLTRRGYRVVERNWRGGGGEVDRIAWDGAILCFVEVRSRTDELTGAPEATVGITKRRRIIRAAKAYLLRFPPSESPMVRFDVVGILKEAERGPARVNVIANAFDAYGEAT